MITELVQLLDKVVSLLNGRSVLARQFFTDHVEPIYEELCRVDADYRNLFSEAANISFSDEADFSAILPWLRSRKRELEPLRAKVDALALALSNSQALSADVQTFCGQIFGYFRLSAETAPASFFERGGTGYSTLIWEIESAIQGGDSTQTRERFERRASQLREELAQRFRYITTAYAQARANALR